MKRRLASLLCILTVASIAVARPGSAQELNDSNAAAAGAWSADGLTRAEMAMALPQAEEEAGFTPPACVSGSTTFDDVPHDSPFCPWIEELARRGVTAGCGGNSYCPSALVTRDTMAVFQVRTLTAGGTARALITRSTTVRPEMRIGTWSARRPAGFPTGVYCLTVAGVNPATDAAIVTVEWGASLGFDLLAFWYRNAGSCTTGEYEVRTYDFAAGGAPVLSNDVEFLIFIP